MSLETLSFGSEREVRKSDFPIDSNLPADWLEGTATFVINPLWVESPHPPTGMTAMCGKLRQLDI